VILNAGGSCSGWPLAVLEVNTNSLESILNWSHSLRRHPNAWIREQ